jgi:hypothetical protein
MMAITENQSAKAVRFACPVVNRTAARSAGPNKNPVLRQPDFHVQILSSTTLLHPLLDQTKSQC